MNRILRHVLIGIAVLIVIGVGGVAVVLLTFDPNKYKPDIQAAVARTTGRTLTLNGKLSLQPSFTPTLHVADAAFSNPPGFSRPQMATLGALDIQIALLPLISGEIHVDRLIMIKPDILLETNAAGQPNWQMTPQAGAGSAQQAAAPSGTSTQHRNTAVSINTISIQDGRVGLRDDRTGKVMSLGVRSFDAKAASPDAPMHLTMDGNYGGKDFHLVADTGSVLALQERTSAPWPVKATLTALGANLSTTGTVNLASQAYDVAVSGSIPDLSAFAAFVPTAGLPPLHDVTFDTKIAGAPGKIPDVSALTAHVGASDLGALAPGVALSALDIKAPAATQPMQLSASGTRGGAPFSLSGTLGALNSLQPSQKPAPFPVNLTLTAAGATIAAKGEIANPAAQTGVNLGLTAQIPDLAALSPLAQHSLPPLKQVAFKATLTDAPNGLRQGVQVKAMSLTSPSADLSGDIGLLLQPRPSLTANLTSNRIDLDALETAVAAPPNASPPATANGAPATNGAPTSAPSANAPQAKRDTHIFPDTPLPFDLLRAADADVALSIATLHASGLDTKAVTVHVGLKGGKLAIDRLGADLPAGHMSGDVTVDATQPAPPVHLRLHAPGLALKSLLAMAKQLPMATGNLEAYADLSGAGATPHAIAASLDGTLSLALAGGTLDNRIIGSMLGRVLEAINLLDLVGKGGTSELRCFATRVRANHGVATIDPLALSSTLLTMSGSGTANLGAETLDMALRPQVRAAATTLVIPVKVTGPMRGPSVSVDKVGAAEANAGTVAGAVAGNATPLGVLGGLLGADKALGLTQGDMCPAALAAARGQAAPAQASTPQSATPPSAAPPSAAPPSAPKLPPNLSNPAGALKSLFR